MDFRNTSLPLGIRNNNPGNIRPGDSWQGMVGTNQGFIVFSDITYGIRAWLIQYHSYLVVHQVKTLSQFIHRYAPENENDTAAYIAAVSQHTGIDANGGMPTDQAGVTAVFKAFMHVENGAAADNISDDDIATAFAMLSGSVSGFFLQ